MGGAVQVTVSSTTAPANERINLSYKADASLGGKWASVVKLNANPQQVIGNGIKLKSDGTANYYIQLRMTDDLKVVITDKQAVDGKFPAGTQTLAESDSFKITVTN